MEYKASVKTITALVSMILTTSAFAENQTNNFSLDSVSVAATRSEQKQEDVASSINIITNEKNEANIASNIRDMIRYEPGIEVGSATGDAARFGSKGFTIRGIDENRIKITVDGVDQANSFTPGSNPFQRSGRNYIDIDTMKRVEIIKGPASTLYGSDAIGGLVAFTTKDPADILTLQGDGTGGSVKLRYGSKDDSFSQTLSLANRYGQLESLLIYTRRNTSEVNRFDIADAYKQDSFDAKSGNVLAKLQYQINDAHRIGLTVEDYKSTTDSDYPSKLASNFAPYSSYYEGDDTIERQRVSIFHQWQANNVLFDKARWDLNWQDSQVSQQTNTIYSSRVRTKDYSHQEESWLLSAQFDKAIANHQLTYGFDYKDEDLSNEQNTIYPNNSNLNTENRGVPLVEATSYGVYLQDQISFMDGRLLLTPGMRYDNFNAKANIDNSYTPPSSTAGALDEHDSDKITMRLGSVFKFNDTASIFAQYSQGFKSPDLIDLYYSSERNYGPGNHFLTLPNADLKPEESDSYELGLRFKGNAGNLELTAFYNEYDNFIESVRVNSIYNGTTYDSVSQSRNIQDVTIWGLEARGSLWLDQMINAPEGTSLQGSIAYAKGENGEDDTPLDSISPLKAVLGLSYDAPNETWGSTVNWTLVSNKSKSHLSSDSRLETAGYGIVDVSAYYKPVDSLTLRAGIFNLTDKEYIVYEDVRGLSASSSDASVSRYTQAGRNASISAIFTF